ncbi:hypothetical protein ABTY61_05860 [Kitasatospora sp. NPDC096128]|uniref:hypothetical protein n=1 Tax=Kitasatospora sp. NPDC096128 TaxID=3155547 RepID=UPI00331DE569
MADAISRRHLHAGPYAACTFFSGAAGVASASYPGLSLAQAASVQKPRPFGDIASRLSNVVLQV